MFYLGPERPILRPRSCYIFLGLQNIAESKLSCYLRIANVVLWGDLRRLDWDQFSSTIFDPLWLALFWIILHICYTSLYLLSSVHLQTHVSVLDTSRKWDWVMFSIERFKLLGYCYWWLIIRVSLGRYSLRPERLILGTGSCSYHTFLVLHEIASYYCYVVNYQCKCPSGSYHKGWACAHHLKLVQFNNGMDKT